MNHQPVYNADRGGPYFKEPKPVDLTHCPVCLCHYVAGFEVRAQEAFDLEEQGQVIETRICNECKTAQP